MQDAQQSVFDVRSQREAAENGANLAEIKRAGLEDRLSSSRGSIDELEMQLREVAAQADTGAQDKQQQLELLGGSDAAYQQRNRELGITEGELTRLEQELNQAKFELLQMESTVARLRADCSGYEVDQKTSVHKHDLLAQDLTGIRAQREAAEKAKAAAQPKFRGGIVTEIIEGAEFFPAEKYHQDFAERNPGHPYVRAVIDPKLNKIRNK